MRDYCEQIKAHYVRVWSNQPVERRWAAGPVEELPAGFRVLVFPPSAARKMWTYATCCMSQPDDEDRLELHLFSPTETDLHVELLYAIVHYHRTGSALDLGHTVNFGRPWLPGSRCTFGLISLPYLDGPDLEHLELDGFDGEVRFLWLIPITKEEREFKKKHGLDALEEKFDTSSFNYLDPQRPGVV